MDQLKAGFGEDVLDWLAGKQNTAEQAVKQGSTVLETETRESLLAMDGQVFTFSVNKTPIVTLKIKIWQDNLNPPPYYDPNYAKIAPIGDTNLGGGGKGEICPECYGDGCDGCGYDGYV